MKFYNSWSCTEKKINKTFYNNSHMKTYSVVTNLLKIKFSIDKFLFYRCGIEL